MPTFDQLLTIATTFLALELIGMAMAVAYGFYLNRRENIDWSQIEKPERRWRK